PDLPRAADRAAAPVPQRLDLNPFTESQPGASHIKPKTTQGDYPMISRTALLAAAGLALAVTAAQAAPVRIATEGAYAPFNFVDDNGELAGFDVAVGNEICKRAELECVWVKNDWDSIIPNLVSGNSDAIMAGMSV